MAVGGDVLDAPDKHRQSFVGTGLPDGPFEKLVCTCPGRRGRRPLQLVMFSRWMEAGRNAPPYGK